MIIGPDTFTNSVTWSGPATARDRIASTAKRIIGWGRGGYVYFGSSNGLGLPIGYGNGVWGYVLRLQVLEPTSGCWQTPYQVTMTNNVTTLSTQSVQSVMIPVLTQGVKALVSYTNTVVRSSIVTLETNGHSSVLWGCTENPARMTENGKRLLFNLVEASSL